MVIQIFFFRKKKNYFMRLTDLFNLFFLSFFSYTKKKYAENIEQLVLSGKLFDGGRGEGSSPERSPSPDRVTSHKDWPEDAIERHSSEEDDDGLDDSDNERARRHPSSMQPARGPTEPIGMRPGRTGVKGVIRDRNEAVARERTRKAREVEELNRRMEKASLGGKTWAEEEAERLREEERSGGGGGGVRDLWDRIGLGKKARFGHLREVGVDGFVNAVEREKGIWVVVHLYDPVCYSFITSYPILFLMSSLKSLDRCADLDSTLTRLARTCEDVKFLRARASALGFASTSSSQKFSRLSSSGIGTSSSRIHRPARRSRVDEDDEEDPYAYENEDTEKDATEGDAYSDFDDDNVDTDVLPTMLVYRDGQLVHNWVRVDLEAGKAGVEELLSR